MYKKEVEAIKKKYMKEVSLNCCEYHAHSILHKDCYGSQNEEALIICKLCTLILWFYEKSEGVTKFIFGENFGKL